jgi:hypothetical protein
MGRCRLGRMIGAAAFVVASGLVLTLHSTWSEQQSAFKTGGTDVSSRIAREAPNRKSQTRKATRTLHEASTTTHNDGGRVSLGAAKEEGGQQSRAAELQAVVTKVYDEMWRPVLEACVNSPPTIGAQRCMSKEVNAIGMRGMSANDDDRSVWFKTLLRDAKAGTFMSVEHSLFVTQSPLCSTIL